MLERKLITCPYCWQSIDILLDLSIPQQEYVEDCSVCCRPILINYVVEDLGTVELTVAPESDS